MRRLLVLTLCFGLIAAASQSSWGDVDAKIYINNEESRTMTAGQATDWKLEFTDHATGGTLDHLMTMHDKKVHLIVVSSDLHDFVHIHPALLGCGSGLYGIKINQASSD